MPAPDARLDSELDSFRRQWLSDLRTRRASSPPPPSSSHPTAHDGATAASPLSPPRKQHAPPPGGRRPDADDDDDGHHVSRPRAVDDAPPRRIDGSAPSERPLVSALDHYEEAMEKEAQGNMGESLKLYRQAYRLDHGVDRRYREKHFPPSAAAPKPAPATPAAPAAPAPATAAAANPQDASNASSGAPAQATADLIASFAHLAIVPSPPEVENTPPPPCPMASLPSELLASVLGELAAADPGAFAAAALVCKPLAYLVATEQRAWRRVALDARRGFPAMHYRFSRALEWDDDDAEDVERDDDDERDDARAAAECARAVAMIPSVYPSWREMFRSRPRIRFNGCYISTVNYVRSGQMSTNQATWGGSPVHIVTYYRYLRFFRDGTAISLLTTAEPADVVRHITRHLLRLHRDRPDPQPHHHHHGHQHLPSAPMRLALRGRWHLGSPSAADAAADDDGEAALCIETEGVAPHYVYRMDMALRSAGRAARNNKLVWRAFHSYNKQTDDWAEFGPRHEKPFIFSRVRSYGMGE